ncbi:hypothetical protein B0H11DRAFT_1956829 [Mycena galericulata]|nr:hypothetical protein B0H11DRAFT_1956829 [Mycena galericulata]
MHRALEILEIFLMICSSFSSTDRSALAALARTCTTFHNPALDVLWSDLNSLSPLLSCMPKDLFDFRPRTAPGNRTPGQQRHTTSTDWDRIIFYAARVKTLTAGHQRGVSQILPTLDLCLPSGLLFPNLNSLRWPVDGVTDFKYIRIFLSSALSSLDFRCEPTISNLTLLSTLARTCPRLKRLSMAFFPDSQNPGAAASMIASSLQHIESLTTETLDLATLTRIGRFPTLKSLHLKKFPVITDGSFPHNSTFATLQNLTINLVGLDTVTRFFGMCSGIPLNSLELGFPAFLSAVETDAFLTKITTTCSHSCLRSLKLTTNGGENHTEVLARDAGDLKFALRGRSLGTLFCFANLISLFISSAVRWDICDDTVADVAQAWPRLENLTLRTTYPRTPVRLTLRTLHHLAEYCPRLRAFEMTFDATTPAPQNTGIPTVAQNQLTSMHVADSPLVNTGGVARFLSSIFPNVRRILTNREWEDNEDPEEIEHYCAAIALHDRWKAVEALVPEFVAAREEERAHAQSIS